MLCRTIEEVIAAAGADSASVPPLTQELADKTAAILAPYWPAILAARAST